MHEEVVTRHQSETHPNVDFKKLKIDKTNELHTKAFEHLDEILTNDDLPF